MHRAAVSLWVATTARTFMEEEASARLPLETGGVLLGYQADDNLSVVVTAATGPGPAAVHSREGFSPDTDFHSAEIARAYIASGRRTTYLGDWHSHPGGRLALSRRDKRTLEFISAFAPARLDRPVMLVLAGWRTWDLAAWQHSGRGWLKPPLPLACIPF